MVQWMGLPARATIAAASVATDISSDHEKLGSIKTCLPLALFIGAAWTLYYLRPSTFQREGTAYIVLVGASFCATSISMHTLNKVCVSLTGSPSTLTLIQMAIAVGVTFALHSREVLGADRRKLFYWMAVPAMYAGMLNSSLLGYKYLTLSLVTVFRNLSPLVTMVVEGFIMEAQHKPKVTIPVIMSLLMTVAGASLFSYGQASSTWLGLFILTLNTVLAIGDRLLQRRLLTSECKDLPLSACMVLNNSLGMIPTMAMAYAMHDVNTFRAHHNAWRDPCTLLLVALSGFMGMGIGFCGLMCQRAMTATSFQVLQNMSKIGVVAVGVSVFGDRMDGPSQIVGMALSLLGSAAYGLSRANESMLKAADSVPQKGECQALLGKRAAPFAAAPPFKTRQQVAGHDRSCEEGA